MTVEVYDKSFEQCIKCTVCTVYCPVAKANPDYPGPKHCGPDGERFRLKDPEFFDETLKNCTNCKICETSCPSGVRIGDLIATARGKYEKKKVNPKLLRNFVLSHTDLFGSLLTPVAPVVNTVTSNKVVKKVMHHTIGVHDHKELPKYSWGTFRKWYKKQEAKQKEFPRHISFFHGCYVNYNHPQLGKDFIKVMNALGFGVRLLSGEKCCGVPLIANGFHDKAKKNAEFNVKKLEEAVQEKKSEFVLGTSSTCIFALQDEYPHVLGVDNSKVVDSIQFFNRFVLNQFMSGNLPKMKTIKRRAFYHTSCHLERSGGAIFTKELLKMLPGMDLIVMEKKCCGSAGTYTFKKENYDVSMKIGSELFQQVRDSSPDIGVSDCETCKWQIEESTDIEVVHPISLIAEHLED